MKEGFYLNKDLNFEYIEDFADYIVERVETDEELFATVVCKFEEAKEIIKYFMLFGDVDFENIQIESSDERGYDDEFCIELWYNDGIINFSCSPLMVNDEYENPCGDETYLFDNCSAALIPLCEEITDLYFVSIEDEFDECDCDEGCNECNCCECKPYVVNVKVDLDKDKAEDFIRKFRNDFYKEVDVFKSLLDF